MKRSILIPVLLGLVVLLIIAGFRQVQKRKVELPKSISQLQDEQGVPVEVEEAYWGTFTLSRTYLGTVEGALQADVVASIMEKIVALPVQVGDRVRRGQVVARLDTKAAMAQYNQLKLAYEDARREVRRMENLFSAGAVSRQVLEKAQLNRDVARRNLESSSEIVALTAPIDGVVTDIFYRLGETTEVGESVVRIADLGAIKVEFKVNHEDRKMITAATPVYIKINGNQTSEGTEIAAKISDISLSADPDSRLFSVWVAADNPDSPAGGLRPGLLVDVRLAVVQKPDAILISRDAILRRNERLGVFVVQDDRHAIFTPLQIGLKNVSEVEVLSGLQPGQTVVVYGQNNLNDGELVNIIES